MRTLCELASYPTFDPKKHWDRCGNIMDYFACYLTGSDEVRMSEHNAYTWGYSTGLEWNSEIVSRIKLDFWVFSDFFVFSCLSHQNGSSFQRLCGHTWENSRNWETAGSRNFAISPLVWRSLIFTLRSCPLEVTTRERITHVSFLRFSEFISWSFYMGRDRSHKGTVCGGGVGLWLFFGSLPYF